MNLRTKTIALVLSVAVLASALTVFGRSDTPAAAASTGAGYSGITPYGGYLGNYVAPDGTRVYCIDSAKEWPSGLTDGGTVVSSLDSLPATSIQKLNYALLHWGQTADPTNAAAVSAFVYAYTSNYAKTNGMGHGAGAHYINGNSAVMAAYNTIWTETERDYGGPAGARATISITMANAYDGSVSVATTPASATGTLTLTGAVVAGTQKSTIQVTNGMTVPIVGIPGADAQSYSIAASASFSLAVGAQQNVVVYTTGSQQRTIRGAFTGELKLSDSDDTGPIALRFSPVVSTSVASKFVSDGDQFVDGVTASIAENSPAWRTLPSGAFAPVVANGTLYGPFSEQPAVASVPPVDAPIVGSEQLTLSGPGAYESAGTLRAPSAGFYTWVWSVDQAEQVAETSVLLPAGYRFQDAFGLVAETHIVPMRISATSQVSAAQIALGGTVGDELAVSLQDGQWLSNDEGPLPAVFEGTAYFVEGAAAPSVSDAAPAAATVLGTATVRADGPGIYSTSTSVTAPTATPGYITWVWALSSTDDFAPYFEPWRDQFGLPAETTRVDAPTVATQAMPAVAVGDDVHDTAMVGGVLPAATPYLVFEAFLQQSGELATCDETTRVFDSFDNPVAVAALGNFDSPVTQFTKYGTYFWIESLFSHDGQLIHRGQCGLSEETTVVAPGVVITQAVVQAVTGAEVHDTAFVSGLVPRGSTLVFEVFAQRGNADGPLCDPSTRVFTSSSVAVSGAGRYDSPATRLTDAGTYFWVETMLDRNGEILHKGRCGAASETTTVGTYSLASTGVALAPVALTAAALVLLGIAASALAVIRRRREYR